MEIDKVESLRTPKEGIIEDLKACISYVPNRDNDLLCFMEQYLKADVKDRPKLLKEIRKCINGQEYKNPFQSYYYYDEEDIKELEFILEEFINNISSFNNYLDGEIEGIIAETIFKVNELHDKCLGELIDSWRDERLTILIDSACKYKGYKNAKDIIQRKRLW